MEPDGTTQHTRLVRHRSKHPPPQRQPPAHHPHALAPRRPRRSITQARAGGMGSHQVPSHQGGRPDRARPTKRRARRYGRSGTALSAFYHKRPPTRTSSAAFTSKTRNRPRAFCSPPRASITSSSTTSEAEPRTASSPWQTSQTPARTITPCSSPTFSAQTFTSLTAYSRRRKPRSRSPSPSACSRTGRYRDSASRATRAAASTPRASRKRPEAHGHRARRVLGQ